MYTLLNYLSSKKNLVDNLTSNYLNILENVPSNVIKINESNFDIKNILYKTLLDFITYNKISKAIVSLSGGVDSMVLISILKHINIEIIAIHINYNNRSETTLEQEFIEKWCELNNIQLYIKNITSIKRTSTKRADYENETRIIRYNFYKEILKKEKLDSIILAHHKDDIIENIFANVCRGRSLLELSAISNKTCIDGVYILRPLLNHFKDDIYLFANNYQIPYFKDTTPDWSVRGKYRNKLFPILKDTFSFNIKENLLRMSEQSNDWNLLINTQIINPFIENIQCNHQTCIFNAEAYKDYPISFWILIFQKLFHKFSRHAPSRKGVSTFMNSIKTKNVSNISLSNECKCRNKNYEITITFIGLNKWY